ncbi:carboxypeptidase B-like isoform X2 [Mizuhopecten yessoensis]|uniref:Carboxypeptidase B n=1 Tax=Mizuhopecten yessoensis TaxID=6573 RepID=A0A210R655_MIZYE|nr:carboxypeptidase B-like isoform X2 [Mizuhopecten yessoensis]OWF56396.1 Carboxypeptidase B [Mizuhopecten yessoensis]
MKYTVIMKTTLWIVCLAIVAVHGRPESKERRYDGHQVLKVFPNLLENFKNIEALGDKYNLDFWNHPKHQNGTYDIHVTPEEVTDVMAELKQLGANANVWINDIQSLIEESRPSDRQKRATSTMSMNHYHSYAEINAFLNSIVASNNNTHLYKLGSSGQGRSINLIRFSTGTTSSGAHKKSIFMDGGIHAREWIAPAVVLYMIDQLANNPNSDPDIANLMDKFDWYLVPLVNPDGYEYTRSSDRMWRKNMASSYGTHHSSFRGCGSDEMGVDLNRNFAYHWNPANGGSYDQCEETYAGPHALSEPETQAMAHALDSVSNHTLVYLNIHSYGQYWIYPWGYTSHLPADASDLDHLGRVAASAIYHTHRHRYTVGEDTVVLYSAAGGADDYAKGHSGIKYAYTVELGDTGHYGFILPERYIQPSGQEIWAGVKAMAHELIREYSL